MSDMTPDLPPHLLAKRKRRQEEIAQTEPPTASGAKRAASPDGPEKRRKIGPVGPPQPEQTRPRRVAGPAPPPAPLDERPSAPLPIPIPGNDTNEDSDSGSDDDFGPSLPSASHTTTNAPSTAPPVSSSEEDHPAPPKPKRDDWMMLPPTQDDLAARLDPLKARPTKFAGKNAQNKGETDSSAWHETPEQKQKRLRDEMMGVVSSSSTGKGGGGAGGKGDAVKSAFKARKDEVAHRIVNEKRGPSLMEQHSQTKGPEAIDDDPSKRAFDREKDMGGKTVSSSQKREMLNKAAGFAGKFSGGSYL